MNKTLCAGAALVLCLPCLNRAAPVDTGAYGRFGEVSIYRGSAEPRDVVLFCPAMAAGIWA